jgi:hypothetical protein
MKLFLKAKNKKISFHQKKIKSKKKFKKINEI